MFKFKLLSLKSVFGLASAALIFSAGVYATEPTPIEDDGGLVTIQCIVNAGQKLCCKGGPYNMKCELTKA
jgi:hypothetical protein